MKPLQDHEVKAWVTPEEYVAATHAAEDSDRTLSGYVRHLIRLDIAQKASAMASTSARDDLGQARDEEGRSK